MGLLALRNSFRRSRPAAAVALGLVFLGWDAPELRAGTELDHPAPAVSASTPAAAASAAAKDPLAIDAVELWMATYYLDPTPDQIPAKIKTLAGQGSFSAAAGRSRELMRFFSAALAAEPAAIAAVRSAAAAPDQEKALLLAIAAKAEHFAPVIPESADDLRLLWAEYRGSGRTQSVGAVIDLLALDEGNDPKGLAKAAEASLLENVPRTAGSREILNERFAKAEEPLKTKLARIAATVNQWYDLAGIMGERCRNYAVNKQADEAVKACLAAIDAYPAYSWGYQYLSNVYSNGQQKPDFRKIVAARQIAAALEPGNNVFLEGLAWAYWRTGLTDQAVALLTKAQEVSPKGSYAPYMLGFLAMKRNDREAALLSFKRYLRIDPSASRLGAEERQFLTSAGLPSCAAAEPTPTDLLRRKDYDGLEARLSALLREKRKEPGGRSSVIDAFDNLTDLPGPDKSSEAWVGRFRDWVAQRPSSALAATGLGIALRRYAWEARGSGWSSTVLDDRRRLFTERLLESRKTLDRACELDPTNPAAPVTLIVVIKGLGLGRDELERAYQRAIKADNTIFEPAQEKMIYLLPKWYGSADEALAFAREAAAAAPAGSAVPLVVVATHRELALNYERTRHDTGYYRLPGVWQEINPILEKHIAQFPGAIITRNLLAWIAYRAGDFGTARRTLEAIGDDWEDSVWGSFMEVKKARKEMAAR